MAPWQVRGLKFHRPGGGLAFLYLHRRSRPTGPGVASGTVSDVSERSREPIESPARRQALNRRLRIAFITGAEEGSRSRLGRGLSEEELWRVLRRYPGDLPEKRYP